ncbi:MAG TPA: hypothetical protein VK206_26085 [Anaerolineales bacterium]|nr:hypothetical protein [Anaerolineales bacterium]
MALSKSRKKLALLFSSIEDDSIRKIISDVIALEHEYRSSSSISFPRKKLEDIIDSEAHFIELQKKKEGGK